jgi:ribosomal protein S18 acetylase RimI-like enzyme
MGVTLRPMSAAEFTAWTEPTIVSYAEDLARANGVPLDVTLLLAKAQFVQMIPAGADTPQTWLFIVVDDAGAGAGTLWLAANPQLESVGFVYDIAIDEAHRGQGLGRAAMLLAEDVLRDAGYRQIQLSVFGFNDGARALYDSLGYDVVATTMAKPLDR